MYVLFFRVSVYVEECFEIKLKNCHKLVMNRILLFLLSLAFIVKSIHIFIFN
jgi:hypothetical protein